MRRGFKSWAEKLSSEQRSVLALSPEASLPARTLAKHHRIIIIEPGEIPGIPQNVVDQLLQFDPSSWSAVSFERNGCYLIIHNPVHSPYRQESNLMHELAHILCNHQPSHLVHSAMLPFAIRTYNSEQEEEAKWLGGCLQLPRAALIWAVCRGMSDAMIAKHYIASKDLVRYRRQMTGIDKQFGRGRIQV